MTTKMNKYRKYLLKVNCHISKEVLLFSQFLSNKAQHLVTYACAYMYHLLLVCKYALVCLTVRACLKNNGNATKKTQGRDFL